jgi:hypothetical protein
MSVVLLTEPFSGGGGGSGTVTSVDVVGGSTGLTTSGGPVTTSGTITLAGVLNVVNGGTGTATPSLVAGTNVTITGTWPNQTINASGGGGGGVTSITFGSTGLTPSTAASGTVTVAGTLNVANGGTGATTLTGVLKGNGTSAFTAATAGTDYQAPITLTTTGSSGAATFIGNTLNIPQYSGGGGTPGGSNTQIQFNSSGSFGGSANFIWDGTNVQLGTQGALRFADADSSNYVAFKAPATVSSNVTWTLPSIDGSAAQVLSTNGAGTLSWVTQSGGGGGGSPNLDGGTPTSNYGGITAIDGGSP